MKLDELGRVNVELATFEPEQIIEWAADRFGPALIMGTGYSPNSAVLLHMVHSRYPWVRAIFVNPGDVPESNLRYARQIAKRMPELVVETYQPDTPLSADDRRLIEEGGEARREVYRRRKLPLIAKAAQEQAAEAILYGARFDQNEDRSHFRHVRPDETGLVRIYPALYMSEEAAGAYIIRNDLPVHEDGLPGGDRFNCGIHD